MSKPLAVRTNLGGFFLFLRGMRLININRLWEQVVVGLAIYFLTKVFKETGLKVGNGIS